LCSMGIKRLIRTDLPQVNGNLLQSGIVTDLEASNLFVTLNHQLNPFKKPACFYATRNLARNPPILSILYYFLKFGESKSRFLLKK
jgi:hypothetical protein